MNLGVFVNRFQRGYSSSSSGWGTIQRKIPNREAYKGPLKAAILDWSGTTADAHVLAPAVVFFEVFKKHGVPISMAES
jgi:phosphonoacetaldehyde hydrolase